MKEPHWPNIQYTPIDYQAISYYSAPRTKKPLGEPGRGGSRSCCETYEKLGIPLSEQKLLAGVAVDAVFDCVSVGTTFKDKLAEQGIIFCSFGEAVREHPELVRKYLGSVVPYSDNFFAALNAAVFSDGSFCYVPKGVNCPMELSTYFRINAAETGQFERTLIVADEGASVSYLEGCTAPCATRTSCTPPWWSWWRSTTPRSSTPRCRTGTPATRRAGAASTTSSPSAASAPARIQDQLDAGGDRLGDHLEVPQRHSPGRQLGGRVLLGGGDNNRQQADTGHEDDPHRQEHPEHDRLARASPPATGRTATAAW